MITSRDLTTVSGKLVSAHAGDEFVIAQAKPANAGAVAAVLHSPVDTDDGRSRWMWIRLTNGDLILGVFPQGATYERLEGEPGTSWE